MFKILLSVTGVVVSVVMFIASTQAETLKSLTINGDDVTVEQMSPTPIKGVYRLLLSGGTVVYSDAQGHYLISGDMFENSPHGLVNLNDMKAAEERKSELAKLAPGQSINFRSVASVKGVLTVFIDVTCPYCQQLHGDVADLNRQGIEVRYLSFPRAGENSPAAAEMAQVWCSKNPQESLNNAFNGQSPSNIGDRCQRLINSNYELGQRMGVKGTPAMVYPDGTLQNGYLPEAQIIEQLKQHM